MYFICYLCVPVDQMYFSGVLLPVDRVLWALVASATPVPMQLQELETKNIYILFLFYYSIILLFIFYIKIDDKLLLCLGLFENYLIQGIKDLRFASYIHM